MVGFLPAVASWGAAARPARGASARGRGKRRGSSAPETRVGLRIHSQNRSNFPRLVSHHQLPRFPAETRGWHSPACSLSRGVGQRKQRLSGDQCRSEAFCGAELSFGLYADRRGASTSAVRCARHCFADKGWGLAEPEPPHRTPRPALPPCLRSWPGVNDRRRPWRVLRVFVCSVRCNAEERSTLNSHNTPLTRCRAP